jgi:hypothetical protein
VIFLSDARVPDEVLKLRRIRELNRRRIRELNRKKQAALLRLQARQEKRFRRTIRTMAAALAAAAGLAAIFAVHARAVSNAPTPPPHAARVNPTALVPQPIWEVEQRSGSTIYSNGLEIRNEFETTSRPRSYHTFSRVRLERSAEAFSAPAGIVFHTTESLLLPIDPAETRELMRTREDLIRHVRTGMLYNFIIDRFGQAFRIVPEDEVAFHAGHSIWSDRDRVYNGLNESFIGVAFETQTGEALEAAQIRTGRLLVDYLRGRYAIEEANCVTHAQVSVNPENMRIGFHTDWAASFPFEQFGLHPGYSAAVSSVALFGFSYDSEFLAAIGGRPWPGLIAAEESIRREASDRGEDAGAYRRELRENYRLVRSITSGVDADRKIREMQ